MIDTFVNRPMEEVLVALPLSEETKLALLGSEGQFNTIFKLVLAYEKADWDKIAGLCTDIGLDQEKLADFYVESIEWSNKIIIP